MFIHKIENPENMIFGHLRIPPQEAGSKAKNVKSVKNVKNCKKCKKKCEKMQKNVKKNVK